MKALVIGGAGFIGRRVVATLAGAGHEVVSADIAAAPAIAGARSLSLDISSFEDVVAAFSTHAPETVINLSYMRETFPRPAFRVNVQGMDNVFEAARLTGVGHVVYTSSIAVNGRQAQYGDRPITEDDATFPTYQYAVHKVFNEWQAREYREKHGMSITGIRVAHAAAPDKLVGAVDHVQCIARPAQGQPARFRFRDTHRCVIHVDDVADIIARVALKPKPDHALYNTGGTTLSLGQIADMVRTVLPAAEISFENDTGGDAHSVAYRFDNSRLTAEFGLTLPPYQDRVARMIAEVRAQA